jgi:hypothetical protein
LSGWSSMVATYQKLVPGAAQHERSEVVRC